MQDQLYTVTVHLAGVSYLEKSIVVRCALTNKGKSAGTSQPNGVFCTDIIVPALRYSMVEMYMYIQDTKDNLHKT